MAMQPLEFEGQLRLQTNTCWISGNTPQDPAAGLLLVQDPRPRINISQMLNEWAILTSDHTGNAGGGNDLLFDQSSLDACPGTTNALQLAGGNNGIGATYHPAPIAGGVPVQPNTNGSVFLNAANAPVQTLKQVPYSLHAGMLDLQLYSPKLQNEYINLYNAQDPNVPPGQPPSAAFQAQKTVDILQLLYDSSTTDMHQLIGEAFYFLRQVRDILGPTGWPKLAVEITGGKSRNYSRRKKRASAKRYK